MKRQSSNDDSTAENTCNLVNENARVFRDQRIDTNDEMTTQLLKTRVIYVNKIMCVFARPKTSTNDETTQLERRLNC